MPGLLWILNAEVNELKMSVHTLNQERGRSCQLLFRRSCCKDIQRALQWPAVRQHISTPIARSGPFCKRVFSLNAKAATA